MRTSYAVGVDVGGTRIAAGLVDRKGRVVKDAKRLTPKTGPFAVVDTIIDLVEEVQTGTQASEVAGVGIGIPGADRLPAPVGGVLHQPAARGRRRAVARDVACTSGGHRRQRRPPRRARRVALRCRQGRAGLPHDHRRYRCRRRHLHRRRAVPRQPWSRRRARPHGGRARRSARARAAATGTSSRIWVVQRSRRWAVRPLRRSAAARFSTRPAEASTASPPRRSCSRRRPAIPSRARSCSTAARCSAERLSASSTSSTRGSCASAAASARRPTSWSSAPSQVMQGEALAGRRDVSVVQAVLGNDAGILGAAAMAFDEQDSREGLSR